MFDNYTNSKLFYIWNVFLFAISPAILVVKTHFYSYYSYFIADYLLILVITLFCLILQILAVLAFLDMSPIILNGYHFPNWTHILGQLITSSALSGVVLGAVYIFVDSLFHKKVILSLYFMFINNYFLFIIIIMLPVDFCIAVVKFI